ncbi:MAG TPA: hypothetical protein VGL84_07885 [Gaiellaceae bacterium]
MSKPDALIEFRYPDGRVGRDDSKLDPNWPPRRGDRFTFDGGDWTMCDREDREGTTVFICKQAD